MSEFSARTPFFPDTDRGGRLDMSTKRTLLAGVVIGFSLATQLACAGFNVFTVGGDGACGYAFIQDGSTRWPSIRAKRRFSPRVLIAFR